MLAEYLPQGMWCRMGLLVLYIIAGVFFFYYVQILNVSNLRHFP